MNDNDKRTILIVDDDQQVAGMLQALLRAEGHDVLHAKDGIEAMDGIARRLPDLILLDLDMPRMNGFDVCQKIKNDPYSRLVQIVVLTGHDEADLRPRIWDLGADEYLTKPFRNVEVLSRCRSLLRIKDLVDELDSAQSVVFALARAIEAKSIFTQGHSERVTEYALALACRVGLSAPQQEILRCGAALHDVGKLAIPDSILNKPGKLTREEYELITLHPMAGVHIVEPLHSLRDAIPLIRWHHERMDGRGYPDGLFAGKIPLLTRVLAVADVFDALFSARPYRLGLRLSECLAKLQENATNGGLDPELVGIWCENVCDILKVEQHGIESIKCVAKHCVNRSEGISDGYSAP